MDSTTITFVCIDTTHMDALKQQISRYSTHNMRFEYKIGRIENITDLQSYNVVISPANCYGELKGGIDMAYYKLLGREALAERVRSYIRHYADGEIHIGDFGIVPLEKLTDNTTPEYLVLCPTMAVPTRLPADSRNAYLYTRAVIKSIRKLKSTVFKDKHLSLMCPIPCVGVGGMDYRIAAKQMKIAIQSMNGEGIIHAINMSKKEEDLNVFGLPHYYACEKMQNMKQAYVESTTL